MGMDSHDGQTGTANALLTEDEARWIADYLKDPTP